MKHFATTLALAWLSITPAWAASTSYPTPEAAVEALVAAMDESDFATLESLLGPDSGALLYSGDAKQDADDRRSFVEAYRAGHTLKEAGQDRRLLVIGANDFEFPVPIERKNNAWSFDGTEGLDELIFRRIGSNELGTIGTCEGFVDAQREYAASSHDGDPPGLYAVKLMSDEGRQNGLYWPTAEGEPASPAGEFVAAAASDGYRRSDAAYHGYRYRLLYRQGASAKGGAREYFKDGLLTEGFALVAWPADYGVSGVMSFIVNQDGVVYQKDLGESTATQVAAITTFDPGKGWTAVTAR